MDKVIIHEPLGNSDHNQIHFDIKVKSERTKLDWNNMLRNKTAIECWNILKYEIESIIDKFVPLKKTKKMVSKHLSKEAIRKIGYRQTMWRVYRRTSKEQDYTNYVVGICLSERNKTAQTMWRVYRRTRKEQDYTNYVEGLQTYQ